MKNRAKGVVAPGGGVVLPALGISQIGGETWPATMAAGGEWRAYVPPFAPQPPPSPIVIPLLFGLVILLAGLMAWLAHRRAASTNATESSGKQF